LKRTRWKGKPPWQDAISSMPILVIVPPLPSGFGFTTGFRMRPSWSGRIVRSWLGSKRVADLKVGLMAHTVSTPVGGDRLFTLQSGCCPEIPGEPKSAWREVVCAGHLLAN
jgi:hypothetical protein